MKYLIETIKDLIGEKNIYIFDGESVDDVEDYQEHLKEILKIKDLKLTDFQSFDGATRQLSWKIKTEKISISVEGETDYFDSKPIITEINKVISKLNINGKFYSFWSGDFGQEEGIFFSNNEEVIKKLKTLTQNNDPFEFGSIENI